MPYKQFDRTKLKIKPLSSRTHDIDISEVKTLDAPIEWSSDPVYDELAKRISEARRQQATVLMMYGAHVIRSGNALFMIELMKRGLVTHFATNGAGAIHDFELALIGATCESVERYIAEGQFGLWEETGWLNDAVREGAQDGLGFGEAVGRYIWENNFPNKTKSVLAMGYHLQVPCTVHVGIGNDIVHEHMNCDGAAVGEASYRDFLIYTQSIAGLERGVFLNFGSAVTGPEVYLKALAMARNAANQEGRRITNFTTAVFDMKQLSGDISHAPKKSDPAYYFRPWKTILARTVADGGESYYVCGDHGVTVPNLASRLIRLCEEQG